MKRILILSPHSDDGECGCGGSITKFIEKGDEVYCVVFSFAKKSIPDGMPKNITQKEFQKSAKVLGIKKSNLILFDYDVRTFSNVRQNILEDMYKINKELLPDLVFMPCQHDTHQDHVVIYNEGFRAFKRSSIFGYEIPWNNLSFNTNAFIFINEEQLNKKLSALDCYYSQKIRMYGGVEFFKTLAKVRGTQIGTDYAECFEIIRWVLK